MFQGNPQKRYMFFCDCASAVDTVDKMQFVTRPDIFTKFNDLDINSIIFQLQLK